jgi:hypothetical protein
MDFERRKNYEDLSYNDLERSFVVFLSFRISEAHAQSYKKSHDFLMYADIAG